MTIFGGFSMNSQRLESVARLKLDLAVLISPVTGYLKQ